jgi:hypothetical protein
VSLTINDLIAEIKLLINDEDHKPLNMEYNLAIETMVHSSLLLINESHNKELYGSDYSYIKIKTGKFSIGDEILIGSDPYTVLATCTMHIKSENTITISNVNQEDKHNTIIIRLEKGFAMDTHISNKSRAPKCTIITV